jgi:hypothetical protein
MNVVEVYFFFFVVNFSDVDSPSCDYNNKPFSFSFFFVV